jgi:A/G-specific adenine glycosylase
MPTLRHLAMANIDDILKLWEGLGYYSRARHLHKAARAIVESHNGRIPETFDELIALPGIGRYTAAAVASIAFGQARAVLDGNVIRVITRLDCIRSDPRQSSVCERLWRRAEELLDPRSAGDFNQAMMELGATICLPRNPQCDDCPASTFCLARQRNMQSRLPIRRKAKKLPLQVVAVGLIWKAGKLLIDKRNAEGLLGGLWELPGGKILPGETPEEAIIRETKEELNIRIRTIRQVMTVDHAYSHFRVHLHVIECRYISGKVRCIACDDFRWIKPAELNDLAFPAANQKIFAEVIVS